MNMEHMNMDHTDHQHMNHEHMHHTGETKPQGDTHQSNHGESASATVVVKGGYSPSTVEVKAGQPVHLVFDRQEEGDCSSHVVFKQLDVDKALPAYQKTALDLGTLEPGDYPFACGMDMLHGVLRVS